ncbi:ABC transporter substrate-binding protein [Paenibacillus hamazuiensis]|uniref:ABC transporter substrate-binding protein n=1 Tax=Paenibacillus hamazuiensis TaxID=2936508 RepID=UPI00200BD62C|nr:extracellular solute-binding protein [Paenibacillus hamazuiensis]
MKKSKKALVSMMAVILLIMSACGGNNQNEKSGAGASGTTPGGAASGKKVKLVFQHIEVDASTPRTQVLRQLTDDYMAANPNITIEWDAVSTDQQKSKLKTQAAANNIPDLTVVNPRAQMKPYTDAGLLAPLDDLMPELKDTFLPGVLDYYKMDNKLYALPMQNNIGLFYYNKKLFEQAGVQPPATYEELIEISKKLKSAGTIPIVVGEKDAWTGALFLTSLLTRVHGVGFLDKVATGEKKFTDPEFVQALDKLQELVQAGAFQDGATSMDNNTAKSLFKSSKAAMIYNTTYAAGEISAAFPGGEIGVFKFPTVAGKGNPNEFLLSPGIGLAVAKNGEHVEEAKKFAAYLMKNYPKVNLDKKNPIGIAQKIEGKLNPNEFSPLLVDISNIFNNVQGGDLNLDVAIDAATTQTALSELQRVFIGKVNSAQLAQTLQNARDTNNKR